MGMRALPNVDCSDHPGVEVAVVGVDPRRIEANRVASVLLRRSVDEAIDPQVVQACPTERDRPASRDLDVRRPPHSVDGSGCHRRTDGTRWRWRGRRRWRRGCRRWFGWRRLGGRRFRRGRWSVRRGGCRWLGWSVSRGRRSLGLRRGCLRRRGARRGRRRWRGLRARWRYRRGVQPRRGARGHCLARFVVTASASGKRKGCQDCGSQHEWAHVWVSGVS